METTDVKKARTCFLCKTPSARAEKKRLHGKQVWACPVCMPPASPKRNKYNARHTYVDGIRFDSKREADTYVRLKALEESGEIKDLQRQVRFELHGPRGGKIGSYRVDFTLREAGKRVALEVKGYKTRDYVLRKKLFLDEYGAVYEHREI